MSDPQLPQSDQQLEFLRVLLSENASIDFDILEIAEHTWAIHGVWPYEGEVPMAMFASYDEAARVLGEICGVMPPSYDS
jgi:hypothetical protein